MLRSSVVLLACCTCALSFAPARHVLARRPSRAAVTPRGAPIRMVYSDYDEKGMRKFKWNLNTGRSPWGMSTNAEVRARTRRVDDGPEPDGRAPRRLVYRSHQPGNT